MRSRPGGHGRHSRCRTALNTVCIPPRRRSKLWEISPAYHCAIIGTCIPIAELRRHARRAAVEQWNSESEYALHHAAVHLAGERNALSQILHKALEARYALSVRTFQYCRSADEIAALWRKTLAGGDIAGALWALMSHAHASEDLLERASQDVHMLSHQVGASSRADLRRLRELERDTAGLHELLERQRRACEVKLAARAQEMAALERRAADAADLQLKLDAASARLNELADAQALSTALADAMANAQRAAALANERAREAAEWKSRCAAVEKELESAKRDCNAAESELRRVLAELCARGTCARDCADLAGRRVLCVGGRSGSVEHYRALVERWRGGFVHHDGGLEHSANQLQHLLCSADAVICAAGNVSHGAYYVVKRFCKQHGKPCVMLRSSGLASFVAGLQTIAGAPGATSTPHIGAPAYGTRLS